MARAQNVGPRHRDLQEDDSVTAYATDLPVFGDNSVTRLPTYEEIFGPVDPSAPPDPEAPPLPSKENLEQELREWILATPAERQVHRAKYVHHDVFNQFFHHHFVNGDGGAARLTMDDLPKDNISSEFWGMAEEMLQTADGDISRINNPQIRSMFGGDKARGAQTYPTYIPPRLLNKHRGDKIAAKKELQRLGQQYDEVTQMVAESDREYGTIFSSLDYF